MARKQPDEIATEIASLKDLLPQLRDYERGIKTTLRVLEQNMSSDAVFDAYEGGDDFDDAHSAVTWRDGHNSNAPSDSFKEML